MKKEQIENMIDKKIEKSISEENKMSQIAEELQTMASNIGKTLIRQGYSMSQFEGIPFDEIDPIRARYVVHYVRHCVKRMKDLVWIIKKGTELGKNKQEMFKLLKFKEKMSCDSIYTERLNK
jgi:hypothetical protein